MKVKLLEHLQHPEISASQGDVIEVSELLARELERHGRAAFLPTVIQQEEPSVPEIPGAPQKPPAEKSRRRATR